MYRPTDRPTGDRAATRRVRKRKNSPTCAAKGISLVGNKSIIILLYSSSCWLAGSSPSIKLGKGSRAAPPEEGEREREKDIRAKETVPSFLSPVGRSVGLLLE